MAKISKRLKELRSSVEANKLYSIDEAVALVKKAATAKFDESIDVSFNLGVDPRKSDQVIRGSVVLPKGTGKTTRVKLPVRILLVSRIWLKKSRKVIWTSMW